jgi:hypothetical protein
MFHRPDIDFLCYRGLLSRLMWTPYEKSESLMLCAVRLRNTTYLCQFATEQNKENMKKMSSREMSKFSRCGFKFEQYMLAGTYNYSAVMARNGGRGYYEGGKVKLLEEYFHLN